MHFALVTLPACVPTLAPQNDAIAEQILALKSAAEAARAAQAPRVAPREEVLVQLVAALQPGGALEGAGEGRKWAYEWLASAAEALPEGGHGIADPRVFEQLRQGVVERDVSCARSLGHVALQHRPAASLALGVALDALEGAPDFVRQCLLSIAGLGEATPATVQSVRGWLADPTPARKDYWDCVRAYEEDYPADVFGDFEVQVRVAAAWTLLLLKHAPDAELAYFEQLDARGQRAAYEALARYGLLREQRALGHKSAVLTDAHQLVGASSVAWLSAGWTAREIEDDTLGASSQAVLLALRRGVGERAVVRAKFEALAANATGLRRAIAQHGLAALDATPEAVRKTQRPGSIRSSLRQRTRVFWPECTCSATKPRASAGDAARSVKFAAGTPLTQVRMRVPSASMR